jgi:hypothetical protein
MEESILEDDFVMRVTVEKPLKVEIGNWTRGLGWRRY